MASLDYFPMYNSYLDKTRKLSDSELGRLVRALLVYNSTGEVEQLNGREEMAFDFIKDDIDRAAKNYVEKCERNSANGSKGGRPRNQTVLEKAVGFSETQKSQNKNKNKNKNKSESNITPPTPQGGSKQALEQAFEDFWELYPKKKSKGQAKTAWDKLKPSSDVVAAIMAKLPLLIASEGWQKAGGQYIPYPATWLNAMGWEDEVAAPQTKPVAVSQQVYNPGTAELAAIERLRAMRDELAEEDA